MRPNQFTIWLNLIPQMSGMAAKIRELILMIGNALEADNDRELGWAHLAINKLSSEDVFMLYEHAKALTEKSIESVEDINKFHAASTWLLSTYWDMT